MNMGDAHFYSLVDHRCGPGITIVPSQLAGSGSIPSHSPTLMSLHLHHSSFYNTSGASPTSEALHLRHLASRPCRMKWFFMIMMANHIRRWMGPKFSWLLSHSWGKNPENPILQPLHRFANVTAHSPTLLSLHLRHSSLYNTSGASPTSQALHLRHLASRPCHTDANYLRCRRALKPIYATTSSLFTCENVFIPRVIQRIES